LRAVLQQQFSNDVTINNQTIKGSNTVQTLLTFAASSILGRALLADIQV
jgi:hypothetical protein